MHIERVQLHDYRNYAVADVVLAPGIVLLVGPNAQGKTNFLEAVHYMAVGESHRTANDAALVRAGAGQAIVRGAARTDAGGRVLVEVSLGSGRTRLRLDGQPVRRRAEALGHIRSVLFAPEDLQLVRGEPTERRRFLDHLLALRRPAYTAARQELDRIVRQRNALLRDRRAGKPTDPAMLATWDDALATAGARVLGARLAAVHALARPTADAYADLVGDSPQHDRVRRPRLVYRSSAGPPVTADASATTPSASDLAALLRDALAERAAEEAERGTTLVGPHRDDLDLYVGDLPARGYASHGEQWSLVLALRLASREVIGEVGDTPVVLLDDVFSELDSLRRRRLAARCDQFTQVLVTTAVADDVPLQPAQRLEVTGGVIQEAP